MRILYLADIRFPLERANGIQSMETCHALARRGHHVTMVVRPDTAVPARDPYAFYGVKPMETLTIERVPVTGPAPSRRVGYLTFASARAAGRARQDLIVTRDLGVASLLLRLPRGLRAPVVYEAHTISADAAAARPALLTQAPVPSPIKLRRLTMQDARVWKGSAGYVTITQGLADELSRRFGPRTHLLVAPDGVRADEIANTPAANETAETGERAAQPFTIGYAGHLYPWKGVNVVVEAVLAIPGSRGLIVGGHEKEPDLARVKKMAVDLDCAGRITFTGQLPPASVPARLAECSVLLLPNPRSAIADTFTSPLKLFEYMASGRPIVASDLPAIREILSDGGNALLASPGNPASFVAAIQRIKEDQALGVRLAAQAREDVRRYTWERRAERLETLFLEIAGGRA